MILPHSWHYLPFFSLFFTPLGRIAPMPSCFELLVPEQDFFLGSSVKWISLGQLCKKKTIFSKIGLGQLYEKNKFFKNWPATTL